MTSSPLKRKKSSPVVLTSHQRRVSHHTHELKLSNLFESTTLPIHHYPSRNIRSNQPVKRTAEHPQSGTISTVDYAKENGSSVQRSVELPKLFSGKMIHPVFQHVDDCDLKFEEISMPDFDIFKPRLLLAVDKDVQAQRMPEVSSLVSSAQFTKTNFMKNSYPSSKALVTDSQSRNGSQMNLFQSITTAPTPTDNDRKKKFGGSNINKKIQEVLREPSDSSIGSLEAVEKQSGIKGLMQNNLSRVQDSIVERNLHALKLDGPDELEDEAICEDLTRGNIVKTEIDVAEKVRIYRRHTDTSKHFYGQQASAKLKKTLNKKSLVLMNSATRHTEKSIDQKSFLGKSYNLGGIKRSVDLSSISVSMTKNRRMTTTSINGTPSLILDKLNFNTTGSSIQVMENGRYKTENDTVKKNEEGGRGIMIKTRFLKTKGKSMANLDGKPDMKIRIKTMLNFDTREDEAESVTTKSPETKAARKLAILCKGAIKESPVKKANYLEDEDVREMTQRSVMKGTVTKPCLLVKTLLPKETEEIQKQIDILNKKVNQHQNPKVNNKKSVLQRDFIKREETTGYLNELDIQVIREEYKKNNPDIINYERLDSVITRLDFFAKLSKPVRLNLLRSGSHAHYPSGSTIIRKGEFGDQMYLILRGSVNVRALKTMKTGHRENITVAVLYDGAHFGEYTLVKPQDSNSKDAEYKICTHMGMVDLETGKETSPTKKQTQKAMSKKVYVGSLNDINEDALSEDISGSLTNPEEDLQNRTANVEVSESCDLLCIPRQQFQNIFLDLVQKELDAKLKLLLSVPLFVKLDPFGLIPLANNLIPKVYKMGEVIISAGQEVEKFSFISQGRCKATLRTLRAADIKSAKNRLKEPKRRNLSDSNFVVNKVFDQEAIEAKDGKLYYADHIEYATLARGHIIGGRSLLSEAALLEEEEEDEDLEPVTDFYLGPARLSIIAESPIVEVYELDMEHLASVPTYLLKIMRRGLKRMEQFDDYDVEKERKEHEEWNKFKDNEVHMVVNSKPKNPDADPKTYL